MRVCMVTTTFQRYEGDALDYVFMRLARHLVDAGVGVSVVAPHAPGTPTRECRHGVEIYRFRYAWPAHLQKVAYGHGLVTNLKASWLARLELPTFAASAAWQALEATRTADLIHAYWLPAALVCLPAAIVRRLPILVSTLGSGIRMMPRCLNRLALRAAGGLTHATAELRGHIDRYGYRGPIFEIRNVRDYGHLDACPDLAGDLAAWCAEADAVVSFIARLEAFKDPLTFIRTAPHVLATHPRTRFLVVGDGPLLGACRDLVRDLDVGHAVRVTGWREDIGALLRASTVFVADSPHTNCYSTTVLEALYLGVPVVLTDVGDPTGSFRQKDYVELCRPLDPADQARAIGRLLSDASLRERQAQVGREFLTDFGFTAEETRRRFLEAYETVLRRPGLGP